MSKAKKISLIILSSVVICVLVLFVMLALSFLEADGFFENYSGWHEVEIPTESEFKATIKIPNEWNFVVENGRIKLKDNEGNVIATEIYEGWREDYYLGTEHYDNKEKMDINPELPEYCKDLDNYELFKGFEKPCYLYKIENVGIAQYAIKLEIWDMHGVYGSYMLSFLFDKQYDDTDVFEKMLKSYHWSGMQRS